MQKVSRFFQIFFKIFLIFFITFIWIRYFVRSLWLAVVISIAITAVIDLLTRFISKKRQTSASLKKSEREDAENMFLSLSLEKAPLDFFYKLASSRHSSEKHDECILIKHPESRIVLFPFTTFSALASDDIVKVIAKTAHLHPTKIVVTCFAISKEAASFAKNFDCEIVILDQYETYQKLYKPYSIFPKISVRYKKDKRLAFKDLAMFSLNRTRAKGYFFSALILVLSSFFVRARLYYCIVASILVVLALVSIYDPFSKSSPKNESLL